MKKTLVISVFAALLTGCAGAGLDAANDTMRTNADVNARLFCTPRDPKCFGDKRVSDSVEPAWPFHQGWPIYHPSPSDHQTFFDEGSARIVNMRSFDSLWLVPAHGEHSRLAKMTRAWRDRIPRNDIYGGERYVFVRLLNVAPLGADTPKLQQRALKRLQARLKDYVVRYRCHAIDAFGAAQCFILLDDELDLGEWLIANGMARAYGQADTRYTKAERFAKTRSLGFWNPAHERDQRMFAEWRKDRYGICWHVSQLPKRRVEQFYASYPTKDDCLQSGGVLPH
ncbi:MAG: hypothetical protein D6712_21115 [Chloroflexi bacterium]|nr:MAG: hypothetical protein D6712_21115 [Chloroflexota bacterium]